MDTLVALRALHTLVALNADGALDTLRTLSAIRTLWADVALWTLRSVVALESLWACVTLGTLWTLSADSASERVIKRPVVDILQVGESGYWVGNVNVVGGLLINAKLPLTGATELCAGSDGTGSESTCRGERSLNRGSREVRGVVRVNLHVR